jgi:hypothetical protein
MNAKRYWWMHRQSMIEITRAADHAWHVVIGGQLDWRRYSSPHDALESLKNRGMVTQTAKDELAPEMLEKWNRD